MSCAEMSARKNSKGRKGQKAAAAAVAERLEDKSLNVGLEEALDNPNVRPQPAAAAPAEAAAQVPLPQDAGAAPAAPAGQVPPPQGAGVAPPALAPQVPPPQEVGRPAGREDQLEVLPAAGQPEEKGDRSSADPLRHRLTCPGTKHAGSGLRTDPAGWLFFPQRGGTRIPKGGNSSDPCHEQARDPSKPHSATSRDPRALGRWGLGQTASLPQPNLNPNCAWDGKNIAPPSQGPWLSERSSRE